MIDMQQLRRAVGPRDRLVVTSAPLRRVSATRPGTGPKPKGLWYSCGTAWIDWLMSDWRSRLQQVRYAYLLDLDMRLMLAIRSARRAVELTRRLSAPDEDGEFFRVNWNALSQDYAGVEVCPYRLAAKRDLLWYQTWDVASGVVWNPAAIRDVRRV